MNELLSAIVSGILGMIGWGVTDFGSENSMNKQRHGNSALSEYQATFWLYLATTPLVWGFALVNSPRVPTITPDLLVKVVITSVINVAAYILFFRALRLGNLSTISALFSLYAAGASIISIIIYGEKIATVQAVALLVLIIGIVGVSIRNTKNLTTISGLKEVLAAVVLFSIFFPFWDSILSSTNPGEEFYLAALGDTIITISFGTIILFAVKQTLNFSWSMPKKVVVFAGVTNAVAVVAVTYGYAATSYTSIITVLSAAVPIVSGTLDYIVNRQKLIWTQYAGITLLVAGTMLFLTP